VSSVDRKVAREGLLEWILEEGQPWVCYRALLELFDRPEEDPEVQAARN